MGRPAVPRFERGGVGGGEEVNGTLTEDGGFVLCGEAQDGCHDSELRPPPTLEIPESNSVWKLPCIVVNDVREIEDSLEEVLEIGGSVLQADDLVSFVSLRAGVGRGRLRDTEHVPEDLAVYRQNGAVHAESGLLGEHDATIRVPNVCGRYEVDRGCVRLLLRVDIVHGHVDGDGLGLW